jgi:hypothetical protein
MVPPEDGVSYATRQELLAGDSRSADLLHDEGSILPFTVRVRYLEEPSGETANGGERVPELVGSSGSDSAKSRNLLCLGKLLMETLLFILSLLCLGDIPDSGNGEKFTICHKRTQADVDGKLRAVFFQAEDREVSAHGAWPHLFEIANQVLAVLAAIALRY